MSAPDAAAAAGITYRQLDHWQRKGWVEPGIVERVSAGRIVRRYTPEDVDRLRVLAHFGRSGVDIAAFGPQVGKLPLDGTGELIVLGPDGEVAVVAAGELRSVVSAPGRFVVCDLGASRPAVSAVLRTRRSA